MPRQVKSGRASIGQIYSKHDGRFKIPPASSVSMPPAPTQERRIVLYSGHVQGVGFRFTTNSIAKGHAVTGSVRNLTDGRVEVVVEGAAGSIEPFLEGVRERMAGLIREETCQTLPPTGEFTSFEILH